MEATRLVTLGDAPVLAELFRVNRDFLAPGEPIRGDDYSTVGRITLNGIVRGPFQSCSLGYWVSAADNGRGLATAAVRDIMRVAFEELGLHRIEAGTLLHNVRSRRVLECNGFVRFGVAPTYLNIAGEWRTTPGIRRSWHLPLPGKRPSLPDRPRRLDPSLPRASKADAALLTTSAHALT